MRKYPYYCLSHCYLTSFVLPLQIPSYFNTTCSVLILNDLDYCAKSNPEAEIDYMGGLRQQVVYQAGAQDMFIQTGRQARLEGCPLEFFPEPLQDDYSLLTKQSQ